MGMGGQRHAPVPSSPGKNRYPLYRRMGGPQGRPRRVRKLSPLTGIRSPDRPARRESLYRLSYPGSHLIHTHTHTHIYTYTVFARVICALVFPILAAEKSGCVKYVDFFLWRFRSGFYSSILVVPRNLSLLICTTLHNYYSSFPSWNFNTSAH
jgi:hypothetical protein